MTETTINRRHLCLALLGTLIVWILAQGAGGWAAASAAPANQTIPTMTPTGLSVTPPVPTQPPPSEPSTATPPGATETAAARSPTPTALLGTSTPLTAGTASPSPVVAVTEELATTGTATSIPTGVPPASDESPGTTPAAGLTPTGPASTPGRTHLPAVSRDPASSQVPLSADPEASDGPGSLLSSPCLWVSAGLVLIALGLVLLVRLRRAG